jgi:membrane protein YqaA with SNARE-associated domain
VHALLESLDAFGGIYVAMYLFAVLSGVFFLANAEAAMIALGAAGGYEWPKLLILAVIVALGQVTTHSIVYWSARKIAKVGAKPGSKMEARLARAHALGEKWHKSEILLIWVGGILGVPPQVLIAVLAGVIEIRFRTFLLIDIVGRIVRFVAIVVIAHLA